MKLLNKRLQLARAIGQAKRKMGQSIFDPHREKILLQQLLKKKSAHFPEKSLLAIYREILSSCRSIQKPLAIGLLAQEEKNAYPVAREFFGGSCRYEIFTSSQAIENALNRGKCDFWVSQKDKKRGLQMVLKLKSRENKKKELFVLERAC
ncbi:MAG: chorismate mutase [Verrucomicrobiae bacterium]|nr:chorismate mutase [Verrucomicrobiae bacterium]